MFSPVKIKLSFNKGDTAPPNGADKPVAYAQSASQLNFCTYAPLMGDGGETGALRREKIEGQSSGI